MPGKLEKWRAFASATAANVAGGMIVLFLGQARNHVLILLTVQVPLWSVLALAAAALLGAVWTKRGRRWIK